MKYRNLRNSIVFTVLVLALIFALNYLTKPKWATGYSSGTVIRGFYEMPKDSVDVLILGSSNVICGVDANVMYAGSGISAYSCGTEAQSIFGSYAWLMEAQRTQSIKAVVLDIGSLFDDYDEASCRKVFDYMHLSGVKLRLLKEYKENIAPDADIFSYLLPLTQYHSRYKELTDEDFNYKKSSLKGFYPRAELRGKELEGIGDTANAGFKEIPEENYAAFMDIVDECREKDIPLVLISCASVKFNAQRHNTAEKLAEDNSLVFLDFNDTEKWSNIDYVNGMADFEHFNMYGAQAATEEIVKVLQQLTELPDRSDDLHLQAMAREYDAARQAAIDVQKGEGKA